MRAFLLLPVFLLISCASQPHRATIHYSPPSVAPARHWVSNAQSHAKAAQDAVSKGDLAVAHTEIDALTDELLNAQASLNELEQKTSRQTDDLNQVIEDKNDALDRNAVIERKLKAIVGQRNKLFLLLLAAAAWIFRGPLLGLIKLLAGGI